MRSAPARKNPAMGPDIADAVVTKKKYKFAISFSTFCGIMV